MIKKIIATVFAFTVVFSASCSKEKWGGKISIEKGVTVIENKGPGLWGEKSSEKIKFIENLSLGVEEGEEYLMFHSYLNVAVDSKLNIYILDRRNHRLLKFDKEGNFIWKAGKKGQGPGELQYPRNIALTPTEDIAVQDGSSIHFFDNNGSYEKTVKLKGSFIGFLILPDGRLLMSSIVRGQLGIVAEYHSIEGKFIKKFPYEYRYGPKFSLGAGIFYGGEFKVFNSKIYLSLLGSYEIREYDLEGKLLRKIKRGFKIKPPNLKITGGLVGAGPSDVSGPCFLFQGKMMVNLLNIVEEKEENKYESKKFLDFFNEKGQFLGTYKMPENKTLSTVDSKGNFYFLQWKPYPKLIRLILEMQ